MIEYVMYHENIDFLVESFAQTSGREVSKSEIKEIQKAKQIILNFNNTKDLNTFLELNNKIL